MIAINKQLGFLPISRFLGEPGQSTYQSQNILQARIDHRFNADCRCGWRRTSPRNPGRRVCRDPLYRLRQPDGGPRPERARLSLGRRGRAGGPDRRASTPAGSAQRCFSALSARALTADALPALELPHEPLRPRHLSPVLRAGAAAADHPRNNLERVTNTALYAQDQIVLSPEWKALVATRLDIFEDLLPRAHPAQQADQSRVAASPRAGLIYQPIPWLSLYTNAGTSFRPNIAPTPRRVAGQATEAGDGTGLRDRRQGRAVRRQPAADCGGLPGGSAERFDAGPEHNSASRSRRARCAARLRADGAGAALAGAEDPGRLCLRRRGGDQGQRAAVGAPLINVPRHSGSLLAVYEVQGGDWKGFGIGGGVRGVGSVGRRGRLRFCPTGLLAADALAYYATRTSASAQHRNVFNTVYYESSLNVFRVYPDLHDVSPGRSRFDSDPVIHVDFPRPIVGAELMSASSLH